MSARPGGGGGSGKGFFWYGFIYLMEAVPVPGGGSFATVSERSEHRWSLGGRRTKFAWWGQGSWAEEILNEWPPALQAGDHDKKHERSEYRSILERQEVVVRNGARPNGGWQPLSGSTDKVSDSIGAELAERKENDWHLGLHLGFPKDPLSVKSVEHVSEIKTIPTELKEKLKDTINVKIH